MAFFFFNFSFPFFFFGQRITAFFSPLSLSLPFPPFPCSIHLVMRFSLCSSVSLMSCWRILAAFAVALPQNKSGSKKVFFLGTSRRGVEPCPVGRGIQDPGHASLTFYKFRRFVQVGGGGGGLFFVQKVLVWWFFLPLHLLEVYRGLLLGVCSFQSQPV